MGSKETWFLFLLLKKKEVFDLDLNLVLVFTSFSWITLFFKI